MGKTIYTYYNAQFNGINKVFYGTPGCGKSYHVEHTVLKSEGIDVDSSVIRTTFYQDYSYSDFIGQILPSVEKGKVDYRFSPGPFTLALLKSIEKPNEKFALIIEELNRGNAPSIFGDIFQLLDRKDGTSIYSVVNVNIVKYLKDELKKNDIEYLFDYIKLPSNLYIFATMNTSDQNVYTLDTAFKRRWDFEKISNKFVAEDIIGDKFVPGLKNVTWKKFVETINKYIIDHATSLSAEDKQIGKYFVDEAILLDKGEEDTGDKVKKFAYKVLEYLWSDVAKFNRQDWFVDGIKSLDDLIDAYMKNKNVFVPDLSSQLKDNRDDDTEGENEEG